MDIQVCTAALAVGSSAHFLSSFYVFKEIRLENWANTLLFTVVY